MNTNIQNIADKLAGVWARHKSWIEVAKATVECACKPETIYYHLKQGEVIQIGDQWSIKGSDWQPCTEWIGCALQNPDFEVRRPVGSAEALDTVGALRDVNADQRVQIEHLEKRVAELEAHSKNLKDELVYGNSVWKEIYHWIQENVKGHVGKRCCDVALDLLKESASKNDTIHEIELKNSKLQAVVADKDATIKRLKEKLESAAPYVPTHDNHIDWKGHHDSLKRQADQAMQERDEKLEKAARYIAGLEQDLSTVSSQLDNWRDIKVTKNGETHALGTLLLLLESQIASAERQRDNWRDTADQMGRNADFYHQLVTDIGDMFGLLARVNDDGTICEDVLAVKVPELVAKLIIKSEEVL